MKADFVDFKAIKAAVSIEQTLQHYKIDWLRKTDDELRGKCPIHPNAEGQRSFHVNVARNVFHCFSCGAKGGVLELVAALEQVSIRDAALKLREWFLVQDGTRQEPSPRIVKPDKTGEPETSNPPLKFQLQNVDHRHPYVVKRGIDQATAETFGVGYFPGKGSMAGRVVIPIADEAGELVAYAGRAPDDSEPKYKFPAGFRKSLVVFNLHRVVEMREPVIVVEGFFDCMHVSQAGFPCVAIMGSALSQEQEDLLCKYFGQVVLCFDGDSAGKSATEDSLKRLARRLFVKAISLPDGKQPDMLSDVEILSLIQGKEVC